MGNTECSVSVASLEIRESGATLGSRLQSGKLQYVKRLDPALMDAPR